jgi:hypothetical protein
MKKKTSSKKMSGSRKQNERPLAARLGLQRLEKLTKRNCLERAKLLQSRAEKGVYKGELREKALKHAYWYRAKAKMI